MNPYQVHSRKGEWIAVILSIVLAVSPIFPVVASPLGQSKGDLVITNSGTRQKYYCQGDQVDYYALVDRKIPQGLFSNGLFPASGVTILVNGWPKATTDNSGYAKWIETAGKPGEVEINITASGPGYGSSSDASISYEVLECDYDLQINYEESYDYAEGSSGTFTVFATVRAQADLRLDQSGALVNEGGGNTVTAEFVMKGIMKFEDRVLNCTPGNLAPGSSSFLINFSGGRAGGALTLTLSQASISLPTRVEWDCEEDPNGRVAQPFSMANPVANLFERAKLGELSFGANGGSITFSVSDGGVFWANVEMRGQGSVSLTLVQPFQWIP